MGFPYSEKKVDFVRKLILILYSNWKERVTAIFTTRKEGL